MFILNSAQENSNELYQSPKGKNILLMLNAGEIGLKTHTHWYYLWPSKFLQALGIICQYIVTPWHLSWESNLEERIGSSSDVFCISIYNNKNLGNSWRTIDKALVSQNVVIHASVNNIDDKDLIEKYKMFIIQLPGKQMVSWNLLYKYNYVKFV